MSKLRTEIEQAVYDYIYIGLNDPKSPYLDIQPEFYAQILAKVRKVMESAELKKAAIVDILNRGYVGSSDVTNIYQQFPEEACEALIDSERIICKAQLKAILKALEEQA